MTNNSQSLTGTITNTVTEWCPYCEHEVELPTGGRQYHTCPNPECGEKIAPCAQFAHTQMESEEYGIPMCVCMDGDEL